MTAFYTPQELAERWKVSARTVVRMTEAGDLPHIKVGKKIRIPAHALSTVEGDTTCTTINSKNAVAGSTGTYTGLSVANKKWASTGTSDEALAKTFLETFKRLQQSHDYVNVGEILHQFTVRDYAPRAVSMSRHNSILNQLEPLRDCDPLDHESFEDAVYEWKQERLANVSEVTMARELAVLIAALELGGRQRAGEDDTRCAVHTEEPVSEGGAYQVAGYRRAYPVATGVAPATVVSAPCCRHCNLYGGTQVGHPGTAKAPDQMGGRSDRLSRSCGWQEAES